MDVDTQPRRRLGLWGWLLLVTGVLGLAVVVTAFWVRTTADLDAERRRATTLGLAAGWADLRLAGPAGDDAQLIRRADAAARRARVYDGSTGYALSDPFAPVPTECSSWQLAGGSGVDAELDGVIDCLAVGSAPGLAEPDLASALARNAVGGMWNVYDLDERSRFRPWSLLRVRVAAGIDEAAPLAARLERLAAAQHLPTVGDHTLSLAIAGTWCTQVLRRRDQLDDVAMAAAAQALAERLDATLPAVVASQPLIRDALLRLPPARLFRAMGTRSPDILGYPLVGDLAVRLGRGPILARSVTAAGWVARHGVPRTHGDILAAAPGLPERSTLTMPRDLLAYWLDWGSCQRCSVMADAMHGLLAQHLRTTTQLRLVAAVLGGKAWPVDPCDPAGGRLREIRRDGEVIGAYGLGGNGVDDGGDIRADWCWPLYAQLGPRRAADQPYTP